jgi:transposase
MLALGRTLTHNSGGDLMRVYAKQHPFYCGIDLHARSMDVCIVNQDGEVLLHRNLKAAPEPLRKAMAPYREGLVVGVECMFTWSWLADLCAQEGIAFVLGHALSMKASHGGNAKHAQIDAHQMALLLRGGMRPQASVYPAPMRATRARLRRRTHLMRQRAELLAPVHKTHSHYNLPELGKKSAYKANRDGVAERFAELAVHKTIAVDLALLTYDDELLQDLELSILKTAKQHNAPTLYLLQTVPGIGTLLSLVLLDEIHDIDRFPTVQAVVSSCRWGTCAKESVGKRLGTAGKKLGNAHLTWAFAEAAALCRRNNPAGQQYLARLKKKHDQGKALTILAHQLARAVDDMLKRQTAFDLERCLHGEWSRAGAPDVSLDTLGMSLSHAYAMSYWTASLNAKGRLGRGSPSPGR